jgi:DnaD/phage-associated family protein
LPVQTKSNVLRVVRKAEPKKSEQKSPSEEQSEAAKPEAEKTVTVKRRPVYMPEEIEIYQKESSDIKRLFVTAEKALGKLLSSNDLSTIFGFYDFLRLPIEVIEALLNHCSEINCRSLNYIEAVAINWEEEGIKTKEQAIEHIQRFNSTYRQILKALGLGSKDPAPAQIKYMDKWLYDFKMPLDVILEACDATILEAPRPTIKYANGIIENWHKDGIKTVEDAKRASEKHRKSVEAAKPGTSAKPNRFANFTQRKWDFESDEMQKLSWAHLEETE